MKDSVAEEIFKKFPKYIRGIVVGEGVSNFKEDKRLVELLRKEELKVRQNQVLQNLSEHPRIASWRSAYLKFGVKPTKHLPSVEALIRRIKKGKSIPFISNLVALFNYISLKHIVPSGGDDVAKVEGNLYLKFANGYESFTPLGSTAIQHPIPGEVIYTDDEKVLCRAWNWRNGDQTKIMPNTSKIVINIDCLPPVSKKEAEKITVELAQLVKNFCGGQVNYYLLDKDQTEVEI